MPVTVDWDNPEKTIVCMAMIGVWTWDEAYAGAKQGYTLLENVPYEVGIIIDLSQSQRIPEQAISHAQGMIKRRHPRTGLTVFVGTNTLFSTLWNVFNRVYTLLAHKQNSVFAPSIEEARAILSRKYSPPAEPAP